MPIEKKPAPKSNKNTSSKTPQRGLVGYSKKSALLEEAITYMNAGKYGQSTAALKELLTLDPQNTEARRLFATLHLRLGSLVTARQAFESLANEAIGRQDFWLAESLLREYLAAGPRCLPFLELLAHVYEEKGDTMAAVGELGKAIEIVIEDPIPDNPKKPSELYAKVRALEPASPVAIQYASLFDMQTGDLLAPHQPASSSVPAATVTLPSQGEPFTPVDEERVAQDLAPMELAVNESLSSEPSYSVSMTPPDQLASPAESKELGVDTGLSAPMPWERIENATIKIETTTSPVGQAVQLDSELAVKPDELPKLAETVQPAEPSFSQESPVLSNNAPGIDAVDISVPPVPEPPQPISASEPPSFKFVETVAPTPEPLPATMSAAASPLSEPASLAPQDAASQPLLAAAAPSLSSESEPPAVSSGATDAPLKWNTGEVEAQTYRPSNKKQNWDKEKGDGAAASPAPVPSVPYSGAWEAAPSSVAVPAATEAAVPPPVEPVTLQKDAKPVWAPTNEPIGLGLSGSALPAVEKMPEATPVLSVAGMEVVFPVAATPAVPAAAPPFVAPMPPQKDPVPEWAQASSSITFVNFSPSTPPAGQSATSELPPASLAPIGSAETAAVDVLFDSTGQSSPVRTQDRLVTPSSLPQGATTAKRKGPSFFASCFSTTRSMVMLCVGLMAASAALVAIGIGGTGLFWVVMEESPTPAYKNLTTSSPQPNVDSRKNGYFLLLGFDAPAERDPIQTGYDRRAEASDHEAARACIDGDGQQGERPAGTSSDVAHGWLASADPAAQMKGQAESVQSMVSREATALKRYQRWLSMPFEDAGYGGLISPNCAHIVRAHRLYLAEGFTQDLTAGLDRLEADMDSWRTALGQSKTLMVKMLAAAAIQDDVTIASGLLLRPDLDATSVGRLGKIVRPLNPADLSLQWPMQSHFVWSAKSVKSSVKNGNTEERPLHVALAAAMPLPVQQRANAYADYYEAAGKAAAEGRYADLPKLSGFIRTSATSAMDYFLNPIELIVGVEPFPSWDPYVGRVVETEARLRLASLQASLKRGAQEGNVLMRLAKSGQAYYDPFTGLPMLVNQKKGVMYSVGRDGKDQDGDSLRDVAVAIPGVQSASGQ